MALGLTALTGSAALARGLAFLLLWLAVAGRKPSDLPVGVAVAVAATWASLILAPPSGGRLNISAALSFLIDFLRLSLTSGLDVARRALRVLPDLQPGVVEARVRLEPGFARNAFCVIASLLPGTLLTGFDPDDDHKGYVHGLDVRQPIAAELAAEEAFFMRTLGHD
jgi:multicomponent Na+:H+ antiporter subunit E